MQCKVFLFSLGVGLVLGGCGSSGDATGGDPAGPPKQDAGVHQPDGSAAGRDGAVDAKAADAATTDASGEDASSDGAANRPDQVVLVLGDDLLASVRERVIELVTKASRLPVVQVAAEVKDLALGPHSIVIALGDTAAGKTLVTAGDLAAQGPEGFIVRSGRLGDASLLVGAGNAGPSAGHGNLGAAYAAYAALEQLGFAFLHPLAPTSPLELTFPSSPVDAREKPRWPIRAWHLHTMHPLELTNVLEAWGSNAPSDDGFTAMLPEWDRFLEWALANRQNRVEWVLLWADAWRDFADGPARKARLKELVRHAHDHGLSAGIDVPIALRQQHGFNLVRQTGDLGDETKQIDDRLDYVLGAGFDFVVTESGSTEFTHPDASRMLAWMNEVASHSATSHKVPAYIKVHCSPGQTADGYADPNTGQPINFNFLPHYADARLGIMPHTVEHYGISDPAPTYGNTDFRYMRDFLEQEVGTREVLWHPESAYWVTFDIDVPLFLPVYAHRRVSDLRSLAADEDAGKMGRGAHAHKRMDGQTVFSSGWEWGYWMNDVVTARAAYALPATPGSNERDAFVAALAPVVRPFGAVAREASALIADIAEAEHALLIEGRVHGTPPSDIIRRNGQAYLQGFDATADLAGLGKKLGIAASPVTQPERLGLVDLRNPFAGGPKYATEVEPLLAEMESTFASLASRADTLAPQIPKEAADLFDDVVDAMRMTALRAKQVHGLYDYVDGFPFIPPDARRLARLQAARDALDQAAATVKKREARYRVGADRIASWREGPTAYGFGYLWPVHTLYFWWRDEVKAVDAPINPCFLNIMKPAEIALGEGSTTTAVEVIGKVLGGSAQECLAGPSSEPVLPPAGLRSRP